MSPTIQCARTVAIQATLSTVESQHNGLVERIARAEAADDYAEASRLRQIAASCRESADRYRSELAAITSQGVLL